MYAWSKGRFLELLPVDDRLTVCNLGARSPLLPAAAFAAHNRSRLQGPQKVQLKTCAPEAPQFRLRQRPFGPHGSTPVVTPSDTQHPAAAASKRKGVQRRKRWARGQAADRQGRSAWLPVATCGAGRRPRPMHTQAHTPDPPCLVKGGWQRRTGRSNTATSTGAASRLSSKPATASWEPARCPAAARGQRGGRVSGGPSWGPPACQPPERIASGRRAHVDCQAAVPVQGGRLWGSAQSKKALGSARRICSPPKISGAPAVAARVRAFAHG
jgi:hypothetical protein